MFTPYVNYSYSDALSDPSGWNTQDAKLYIPTGTLHTPPPTTPAIQDKPQKISEYLTDPKNRCAHLSFKEFNDPKTLSGCNKIITDIANRDPGLKPNVEALKQVVYNTTNKPTNPRPHSSYQSGGRRSHGSDKAKPDPGLPEPKGGTKDRENDSGYNTRFVVISVIAVIFISRIVKNVL